ncbi:MAG: SRPBCC family protein [Actinomycetes bacterium]
MANTTTTQTSSASKTGDRLAKGLGLASLGLGLPQVLRPRESAKAIGLKAKAPQRTAITAVGVRELAAAAGLLRRTSPGWLWTRVGGDAMDLALLGRALRNGDTKVIKRTAAATAGVVAVTAVDVYAALTRSKGGTIHATATTTIGKTPQEVYAYWQKLENLPTFMAHLEEVRRTGDRTSHWKATAPFGTVEWDAITTEDVPGTRLSWKSAKGADVANEGTVEFRQAPGDQGTEVHVQMTYQIPAGKLGEMVARYFGEDPHQQLDDDLRRFKQVMETGEVVRSEGAPYGKKARKEFPQRAARPLGKSERKEVTTK